MVFKVLYQEIYEEIPVRERTSSLYIEGDSEEDVRNKLSGRNYNIEFIQFLDDAHLAYEKKSGDFELETA